MHFRLTSDTPTSALALSIPPELFPLISSFIPLRSASQTLLALALGNSRLYAIVRPLLYSRLILENEDHAIAVTKKILDEPRLGMEVTEMHIMAELSVETREGKKAFDIIAGLRMLVNAKLLPRLVALGIYLSDGWEYDENWKPIVSHGQLPIEFWRTLRAECPRLRSLSLRNTGHGNISWLTGPVVDAVVGGLPDLSVLRLEWVAGRLLDADNLRVFDQLSNIASTLHTLHTLSLTAFLQEVDPIFQLEFLNLRWLRLHQFGTSRDISVTMDFFRRHPQLESLSLVDCSNQWFSADIDEEFLPNLKHLKARFEDIRILEPLLRQLVSLAFTQSYNCQVPYLLRSVIRNGLPTLKSLEIEQLSWEDGKLEGACWYETVDGKFHTEKRRRKIPRDFMDDYMHSIVRGTRNLEELGLHGITLDSGCLTTLAPMLAQFSQLKRFYCRGYSKKLRYGTDAPPERHPFLLQDFINGAETLARACTCLERVTSISAKYMPYISLIVERDSAGEVTGVRRSDYVGMEMSAQEDDPFPSNP